MATISGIVGQQTITSKSVIDARHPAVVRLMEFKANSGIIPAGEIMAVGSDGKAVSYDPAGVSPLNLPVGICTEDTDTAVNTAGSVAVHGTVMGKSLLVKGETASASEMADLESNTSIWIF
jgi:hypothetical protein